MTDKTIRIGLTKDQWASLYVATGGEIGRVETLGLIQDKSVRDIAADVRDLNALRDKIAGAIYGKKE